MGVLFRCVAGVFVVLIVLIGIYYGNNETDQGNVNVLMLSHVAKQRLQEAVEKAGRGPSPAERAKLRHMMMPIANHLATRSTYKPGWFCFHHRLK